MVKLIILLAGLGKMFKASGKYFFPTKAIKIGWKVFQHQVAAIIDVFQQYGIQFNRCAKVLCSKCDEHILCFRGHTDVQKQTNKSQSGKRTPVPAISPAY